MTLRDRYYKDNYFHTLVDMMVAQIQDCNFTPSEMREAAILASIIYEEHNLRDYTIVEQEMEGALRTIRRRLDETDGHRCRHEWWDTGKGFNLCKKCTTKELIIP